MNVNIIDRIRKNNFIEYCMMLNQEFFSMSLITYLLVLLVKTIWNDYHPFYLNMDIFLFIIIISGAITILTHKEETKLETQKITIKDYIFIICVGIFGSAIILYKTPNMGWMSYIISAITGILIILLSILVLEDENKNEGEIWETETS